MPEENPVFRALTDLITATDPNADAGAAAQKLLEGKKRAWDVFEMAAEDISAQAGLSPQSAQALDLVDELCRYAGVERLGDSPKLDSAKALGAYFGALLLGRRVEYCYLACMDARHHLIRCVLLGRGTLDSSPVHLRDIAQAALRCGAVYAALAHNHPGGALVPSAQDVELTRRARQALRLIDVSLTEHVIVARSGSVGIIEGGYV